MTLRNPTMTFVRGDACAMHACRIVAKGKLRVTAADVREVWPQYNIDQVCRSLAKLCVNKYLVRLSRGVYRARGEV